jgi:lipoyl(octanoyl) transferase
VDPVRETRPPSAATRSLWTCWLGRVAYDEALALQHALRAARQAGAVPDVLLLLEHDPVYTRGRRTAPGELPVRADLPVVDVDRGGKLTYHGPGQLVGYGIAAVDDVVAYVRTLERALVAALAEEGVAARSRADEGRDFTGVWVEDRKVASIGVHVQRGVTTHGFAVNVDADLTPFTQAIACGLPGVSMTSLLLETGRADAACFRKRVAAAVADGLGRRQRVVSRSRLERHSALPAPV